MLRTLLTGLIILYAFDAWSARGFAAIATNGTLGDDKSSLVYEAATGSLWLDLPERSCVTVLEIISQDAMFLPLEPTWLQPPFDVYSPSLLFLLRTQGVVNGFQFGNVLPAGLSPSHLSQDLRVGGGSCFPNENRIHDLVYLVPESRSTHLLLTGLALLIYGCRAN